MSIFRFLRKIRDSPLSGSMNTTSPLQRSPGQSATTPAHPPIPASGRPRRVQEPFPYNLTLTERHLHCVWADYRLRPALLKTTRGEELQILHPGEWNHGAGPDFRNAEWQVGGRRVQGDVEVHLHPMDWVHHGHQQDPGYREVRLHVTYFHGELPLGTLPPGCEEVSLKRDLDHTPHFFFENIDVSAYPWEKDRAPTGLRTWFQSHDEASGTRLLEAAGLERLRRKTLQMLNLIRSVGPDQALYQILMRGLGYSRNAETAEQLAVHLPFSRLLHVSHGNPVAMYTALLGSSGLLPHDEGDQGPSGIPPWFPLRRLWDLWWRMQEMVGDSVCKRSDWHLDQCRPGNHPARRFWAAAVWFQHGQPPSTVWSPRPQEEAPVWIRRSLRHLQTTPPPVAESGSKIVGPDRSAALFVNAVLPWWLATSPTPDPPDWMKHLPVEPMNGRSKRAALSFLGRDAHPRMYKGALHRQGLLQLAEDYGL